MTQRTPAADLGDLEARLSTDLQLALHMRQAVGVHPDLYVLVVATDAPGTIVRAEGGGLARLGWRPEDLQGSTVEDRWGPAHPLFTAVPVLAQGWGSARSWLRQYDGDPTRWDLVMVPYVSPGGRWLATWVWANAVDGPDLPSRLAAAIL